MYIDPSKRYYRNDFIDIQKAPLSIEVAGGLCNKTLGVSAVQVEINGCSYWRSIKQQTSFQKVHLLPAHVLDLRVTNVTSSKTGKPHRSIIEELSGKDAIESIDLRELGDAEEHNKPDAPGSPGGTAATRDTEMKLVRFQVDGDLKLDVSITGAGVVDTGFCVFGNTTGGSLKNAPEMLTPGVTSSIHAVRTASTFVPVAKMKQILIDSESLTCDILPEDLSVRFVNKVQ